jgi:hypothetical protein
MKKILPLLALAAALAVAAPLALAAKPKLPSTFVGGGEGAPLQFKLNKRGAAKATYVAFSCKNLQGIGTAKTRDAKGKVRKGRIKITYTAHPQGAGTIAVTINARFTSKTHAKGTVEVAGPKCKGTPSKHAFTADAR